MGCAKLSLLFQMLAFPIEVGLTNAATTLSFRVTVTAARSCLPATL